MENIIEPTANFDFSKLNLENPSPLQGGNFFTKINYTDKKLPLYVQLPKCVSKHGIIKNSTSKKSHIDLMFKYFETDLLSWFENLELKCTELIHNKKDIWFQTEITSDDIENMFISSTKAYRSGKYITIRVHIPHTKHIKKDCCMIYDENERVLDASSINELTELIPLVCIDGIKFSSKSFQLDINLPQIMIMSMQNEIKNECLIKSSTFNKNKDALEKTEPLEETMVKGVIPSEEERISPSKKEEEERIPPSKKEEEERVSHSKEVDLNSATLQEVQLHVNNNDNISLKNPNDIYYEIYKAAKEKAKHMKLAAIEAYLEVKSIKSKYMLDEINSSEDEISNFSENEE